MLKDEIFSRVQTLTSNLLRIPKDDIKPESRLIDDLAADSLFMTQVGIELEDEFEIIVDDTMGSQFTTVQDVVDFVAGELEKK